jgi:hypothetical protein
MKTRTAVIAAVTTMVLTGQLFLAIPALPHDDDDDDNGGNKAAFSADHALFFTGSQPSDTHLVCGTIKKNGPYILHISVTADCDGGGPPSSPGTVIINFLDGDSIAFNVPACSSYSISQALGGNPKVDGVVMITQTGGVKLMMASVLAINGKGFCDNCTGVVTGSTASSGSGDAPGTHCKFP